jgi:hypothetical protein
MPADHQAAALGWEVPLSGDPTDKKSTMPTMTATAPTTTRRLIC